MSKKGYDLTAARQEREVLARAAGLLPILEDLGIDLDTFADDNSALTVIEATQLAIMLDPKSKRPTRLKAARDLAQVRGLDKQSRIAEDERRIRKIREGLRAREERVVDGEFSPEAELSSGPETPASDLFNEDEVSLPEGSQPPARSEGD